MTSGFTDIHQHLMYGMDDGPKSSKGAQSMIQAAKRDGIVRVVVTPHVTPGIEAFDYNEFVQRLEMLQVEFAHQEGVRLFPGAEIFYTEAARRHLIDRRIPTLAGTEYVLVEFSPEIGYREMHRAVEDLSLGGYIPVLAHVERYQCLVSQPGKAIEIKKQQNVRFQVNCSTIIRKKGFFVNRFCRKLLSNGLVDAVATDAHNLTTRPVAMSAAYKILEKEYGAAYAGRLTGVDGGLIFS